MKISVLMSVYHADNSQHLEEALDSIWVDQIRKPDEIVLVEDGPLGSDLEDVIENFQNKSEAPVINLKLERNSGLASALNKGVTVCSGDLIARMDADDISAPERFKLQHDFFTSNPETDILGAAIQEFSGDQKKLLTRYYPENLLLAKKYIPRASPFAHPTVVFRRKIFDAGFRYSEQTASCEDIELWFRLLAAGYNFSNLPIVLLNFRISNEFAGRRSSAKAVSELKVYWSGVIKLFGWNWRLIFPLARFAMRLTPKFVINYLYKSRIREILNTRKT